MVDFNFDPQIFLFVFFSEIEMLKFHNISKKKIDEKITLVVHMKE